MVQGADIFVCSWGWYDATNKDSLYAQLSYTRVCTFFYLQYM